MNLHQKAKHLMRAHRFFPKKHLGQNFVVNNEVLKLMSSYAAVGRSDVVLEIGAGFGFLTRLLSQKSERVIAVEADTRLVKVLRNELDGLTNVKLIEGNILKVAIPPFNKVVSNPPFSISSQLLFWLPNRSFDCAVLTLQKEFARRLNAPIGSRSYGALTVFTAYRVEVELLKSVPSEAFYPPPSVDVVIVKLKSRKAPPFKVEDEKVFDEVVRTLFTKRNRKIRNAVLPFLHERGLKSVAAVKRANSLSFNRRRARELAPEDFGVLANELSA